MNSFNLKIKLIYTRVLVVLFIFLAIYSFLHWLLFIRLQVFDISETIIVWVLPFLLSALPVWLWLRKRIRLLDVRNKKREKNPYSYLVYVYLFISGVTVAFQFFLISAAGELRPLKSPEEIAQYKRAKYYTIEQFYANKSRARLQRFTYTSRKSRSSRYLNYEIFIAVPLYKVSDNKQAVVVSDSVSSPVETGSYAPTEISTINDTVEPSTPPVWVCLYYKTRLSNNSSIEEKDEAWDIFKGQCIDDFKKEDLSGITYFEYPGNNEQRDKLVQTVHGNYYEETTHPYVLTGKYTPYVDRYARDLEIMLVVLVSGCVLVFFMILLTKFDEQELEQFLNRSDTDIDFFRGYI